jgi:hypothetical protein
MTIMDRFINRYVALRYFQSENYRELTKKEWSLSKDEIIIYLESGDEVAVTGTKFLRMAETDLNSETVDNCAH